MKVRTVIEPTFEPITLTEAKAHLRVDFTEDDAYITSLITVARQYAETRTWRAIPQQTFDVFYDEYTSTLQLPRPPLISVTSVSYKNSGDTYVNFNTTDYVVDFEAIPAKVVIQAARPQDLSTINPLRVRFVSGYANANSIPAHIKHAIKMLVSHFYENRELVVIGRTATLEPKVLPIGVEALLDLSSVRRFF